jgi:hypothetical protein
MRATDTVGDGIGEGRGAGRGEEDDDVGREDAAATVLR